MLYFNGDDERNDNEIKCRMLLRCLQIDFLGNDLSDYCVTIKLNITVRIVE